MIPLSSSYEFGAEMNREDPEIHLCQIDLPAKQTYSYLFTPPEHTEIKQGIYNKIPLEKLLKHIHYKFDDKGLVATLIHRIYESNNNELEYYVPELVYITIQRQNQQMKKVLIRKSAQSQNLRRLILWNVKAFTVLMKQRDPQLKIFIGIFENAIISTVQNKSKFNHSQKAISMLTTASLILKKLPKDEMKPKLKKFIQRFNYQILKGLNHTIMIPFRSSENQIFKSNYVVKIVQDQCSCFPTRKRVPYRIILETIDPMQLKKQSPNNLDMRNNKKPEPDEKRDLFNEVSEETQKIFHQDNQIGSFVKDGKYPFVIDQQQYATFQELTKFAKLVEDDEKQVQKAPKKTDKKTLNRKDTLKNKYDLNQKYKDYQIKDNEQLRKYDAIYIPTLPSNMRKSAIDTRQLNHHRDYNQHAKRWTSIENSQIVEDIIKIWEQQPAYEGVKVEEIWGQPWQNAVKKLRQNSSFKKYSSLKFHNVVIKGGDDLRQEIVCMQMIYKIQTILKEANLDIFIKPYEIIVLSENSGLLEFVANSISIDGIKKERKMDLPEFYLEVYNTEAKFLEAKAKFIRSLAGSSILTYVLRLKDRHNGNILIDKDGNIIHIDFGFILGMSPGGLNFQSSPFKLTEEYVVLMGGKNSPDYNYFKDLFCTGMAHIRKRLDEICLILEIMMNGSDLDCFINFDITNFRSRFQINVNDKKFYTFCESLVEKSCLNSRTVHYDTFQKLTNGINP